MSIQDMEDLKQQYLDEMKTLINGKDYHNGKIDIEIKINELKENFNGIKEYTIAITPDLPTEEPDNSLSMGVEHLDTIPTTESDEVIKSSVEKLVLIPSEFKDFSDIKSECDSNREYEEYISLLERLLYDNSSPRPPEDFHANPNTIIESLPEFESFHVDYPDSGDSTIDVVEDIPVDMPNILATHPTLHMDFDFIPSHNDLGSDLDVSSPFGDRNKIYDPGICIEVESTRFLAILSPVIDTLLPFSSKNEDKGFKHGVLALKEKSPPSSSHRGFKASKVFHQKILILIHGGDIPILDFPFLHFYPP
ncbi:hypothetical protein Tco_0180455 [Tanacetum coccineum]